MPEPKLKREQKSANLTVDQWARLKADAKRLGRSESDLLVHMIDWGYAETERLERAAPHEEAEFILALVHQRDAKLAEQLRAKLVAHLRDLAK